MRVSELAYEYRNFISLAQPPHLIESCGIITPLRKLERCLLVRIGSYTHIPTSHFESYYPTTTPGAAAQATGNFSIAIGGGGTLSSSSLPAVASGQESIAVGVMGKSGSDGNVGSRGGGF